jgi:hypothetical protein
MKLITRFILSFLSFFSPKLKQFTQGDQNKYSYAEIERNSKCYCQSGEKYKHCHLIINQKHNEHALIQIDKFGNKKVVVFNKNVADKLKGKTDVDIELDETFSEMQVGLGAHSNNT